ncbi:MAG: hypothetical protein U0W24_07785 [Bacteroidales bacterium]
MKRTFFIALVLVLSISVFSQKQPQYVYCIIDGTSKLMSNKVTIRIDFGDNLSVFADNRMRDPKTGKPMVFNSMVDALNFMGRQGWEFVQAYAEMNSGTTTGYHFLMKKAFNELDKETQLEYMKE